MRVNISDWILFSLWDRIYYKTAVNGFLIIFCGCDLIFKYKILSILNVISFHYNRRVIYISVNNWTWHAYFLLSCNINLEVTQQLVWYFCTHLKSIPNSEKVIRNDLMSQIIWVYRKGAKLVAQLHRHLHLKRWKTLYIHSYLCSISICKTDAHCKTNWIWHFTGFHLHYNKKAAI